MIISNLKKECNFTMKDKNYNLYLHSQEDRRTFDFCNLICKFYSRKETFYVGVHSK